jgi:hypothetical protein
MSEESARGFVEQVREMAASAAPVTREQALEAFRQRVHAILTRDLKFAEVEWNERRDLKFAVEDRYFRFLFDENDHEYIAVYGGLVASYKDEQSRIRAMEAATASTREVKVGKAAVTLFEGEWVVAVSAEAVVPSLETVDKAFVRRLVRLCAACIGEYHRRYAELAAR